MGFIVLFITVCFLHSTFGHGYLHEEWETWKNEYGKHDFGEQEEERFKIWENNYYFVTEHNKKYDKGETTYMMGMNKFAAMTDEELQAVTCPLPPKNSSVEARDASAFVPHLSEIPESIDWRNLGYVTAVKDQRPLASCYAFSVVGAVEGQYRKQTGNLISLSEQQIVDCYPGKGHTDSVYKYLTDCGGLEKEETYPYTGQKGPCQFKPWKVEASLQTFQYFTGPDENKLKCLVANYGPVSVGQIKVFNSFFSYKSGVYDEPECVGTSSPKGWHAMLVVGYVTKRDGTEYWIVKNSWGTDWGNGGYIWMVRNKNNNCGIADEFGYPVMAP